VRYYFLGSVLAAVLAAVALLIVVAGAVVLGRRLRRGRGVGVASRNRR
jgi:hypothetical protein